MDKQLVSTFTLAAWLLLLQGCGDATAPAMSSAAQLENTAAETLARAEPDPQSEPENAGVSSSAVIPVDIDVVPETDVLPEPDVDERSAEDSSVESISDATKNADPSSKELDTSAVVHYKIIPAFPFAMPVSDDQAGASQANDKVNPEVLSDASEVESSTETTRLDDNPEEVVTPAQEIREETESDQTNESTGVGTITDLIFLTGQSNAASLVTKYDAELDSPDERVFAYTDQGWQIADLHQFWDEGIPGNFSADNPEREPYNNIIFQVGKALADSANRRVGIVMLTAPGEGISHWDYSGQFYGELRDHAVAALNAVPHKSSFDAVVWMQGETDWLLHGTADPDVPDFESYQSEAYLNYYPNKLSQLIETLRSDPWFGSSARFICTETIKAAVNTHLMALNSDEDSLTGCAAASDLDARENDPQGNHFSAESLRILGKRIADIYLALRP